jgi:hypothetical protein
VPSAVQRCLPGVALVVDDQRVNVHPAAPRHHQFHPVGPPVGFDLVAHGAKRREYLLFERAVNVDINVSMRPSLATDEGIDAPAPFQPEPAAHLADDTHDGEHLINGGARHSTHSIIVTAPGEAQHVA